MAELPQLTCRVTTSDTDVRSARSFRRHLSAEFVFDDRPSTLRVEGVLLRVLDGWAVESVDRDDLNVPLREKTALLMGVLREAGLAGNLDPKDGVHRTHFEVSDSGRDALSRQADESRTATWH